MRKNSAGGLDDLPRVDDDEAPGGGKGRAGGSGNKKGFVRMKKIISHFTGPVNRSRYVTAIVLSVIVGAILGRFVIPKVFAINETPTPAVTTVIAYEEPTVVLARAQEANKMISVERQYTVVEKMTKSSRFFDLFDIPFSESGYWMLFIGNISAGVDLSQATMDPVDEETKVITIHLPEPTVLSNTPDLTRSGTLEGTVYESVINHLSPNDTVKFEDECMRVGEEQAQKDGLIDEARKNTEENLRSIFFGAFADQYEVQFVWDVTAPAES